ncbi:hypothetical protein [Flagellimonas pacifica]|uniref:Uncharacterized protein n=1 Tax=Flagellimonas pacifica TaxID=1247520 RepID=A0A285MTB2_9FLAO|nr:hypothetical protein [Allomuricauda parva]SNY99923.1 hypothetical protein SAMN06265377_1738 [Allomuricauda parva]
MNILICYDEQDGEVGHFVERCMERTVEILDDLGFNLECLDSAQLNPLRVSEIANQNGDNPFVSIAYSHGREEALIVKSRNEAYISTTVNQNSFRNAFFYTWACQSGNILGEELCRNYGCVTYIGYDDNVVTVGPLDPALEIFVDCAVHGLERFYVEDITAIEALNSMKDAYDEAWEELIETDQFAAIQIQDLSNALVISGNEELKFNELLDAV